MHRRTSTSAVITTACVGMAVGAAAYMMTSGNRDVRNKTRKMKKNTGKALRQVGDFIDNVSYMIH